MNPLKSFESSFRDLSRKPDQKYVLSYKDNLTVMEALDHYFVTKQYQEVGLCTLCKTISSQMCCMCGAFYCNSECQNIDWPRHRSECLKYFDKGSDSVSVKSLNQGKISPNYGSPTLETDIGYLSESYVSNMSPFKTLLNYTKNKKKESFTKEDDGILSKLPQTSCQSVKKQFNNGNKENKKQFNVGNNENKKHFGPGVSENKKQFYSGNHENKKQFNNSINENKKQFNNDNNESKKQFNSGNNENKKQFSNNKNNIKPVNTPPNTYVKKQVDKTKSEAHGEKEKITETSFDMKKKEKDRETEDESSKLVTAIENLNYVKVNTSPTLTTQEPKEVICTHRESQTRHWVMDAENMNGYIELQKNLAENIKNFEKIQPKVGIKCAAMFSNEWSRGEIISTTPELTVRFIDFGNTAVSNCEIKKLPENLDSIPGLAYLIEFENGTPNRYRFENLETLNMKIKETRKASDGVSCVEVIDSYFEQPKVSNQKTSTTPAEQKPTTPEVPNPITTTASIRKRSVLDYINENSKGIIFLVPGKTKVKFGSIVPDENSEVSECLVEISNLDSSSGVFVGNEEDYVLVSDEAGEFQRGKIISKLDSIYYVLLIDTGNVIPTEIVYRLPEKTKELIELGGMLTFTDATVDKLESLDEINFEITGGKEGERWPCVLKHSTEEKIVGNAFLEKSPESVEPTSTYAFIKNGSTVVLSAVCSSNSFYVRSLDQSVDNKLLDINTSINNDASQVKSYKSPPKIGEICCAKFEEDGFYYRATVTKVKENKITVLFVDFGNTQDTKLENIKPVKKFLKKIPFLISKVTLAGVPSDSVSQSGVEYIKDLLKNENSLILTYKDGINDGVVLTEKDSGKIVNEFLTQLRSEKEEISPSTNEDIEVNLDIITKKDLNYVTLNSETESNLCVLYVNKNELKMLSSFWATDCNNPNLVYIFGDMIADITSYCSKISESHTPRVGEVCFAEFEGSWYRALTMGKEDEDIFEVLFLDFGNKEKINVNSIREMDRRFLEAPVLAINCSIAGKGKFLDDSEKLEKMYNFLQKNTNSIFEGVKTKKIEENYYSVSIPELESLLVN